MAEDKKVIVTVQREYSSNEQGGWTLGTMKIDVGNKPFTVYTCEDEGRKVKVPGETRIPAGIYALDFNTTGGMNVKYKKDYPDIHVGMIELQGVAGEGMSFGNVYIHVGNFEKDTAGCILVGMYRDIKLGTISQSRLAYRTVYKALAGAIKAAKANKTKVYIEVKDIPRKVADATVKK